MQCNQRLPVLITGYVKLQSTTGETYFVRVFFDPGSEVNLMTEKLARMLKLKRVRFDVEMKGSTGRKFYESGIVTTGVQPWFDQSERIKFMTQFMTMKQLPQTNPFEFDKNIPEFSDLILADPEFNKSSQFHLLLGIEFWSSIIREHIVFSTTGLCAQKTVFGYVVFGSINQSEHNSLSAVVMRLTIEEKQMSILNQLLTRFWELSDPSENSYTVAEERAERYFSETVQRDADGRFTVRIPFIDGDLSLGDSKEIAKQRLKQLERRFNRNSGLREKYNEFMEEYLELGHMREATTCEQRANGYYIPHHSVIKRFRVVFDASCATSNGKSANDIQLAGPNRQEHLSVIIMRFRFHKIVFSTDVRKMFRQFKMHPEDLNFQKILWRFSANDDIKEYVLLTVTYGMKSSPFLAIRCMIELANMSKERFPLAARATELERYMDDYFSGADTDDEVVRLYEELREMLAQFGLELGKWKTNSPKLLERINCDFDNVELSDEYASVLGLNWCPRSDCFTFKVELAKIDASSVTKRHVVSEISKLYDPNGYLGPVIVRAKLFIQKLWILKLEWNDVLSEILFKQWKDFYEQLIILNDVCIPRWLQTTTNRRIELIGFADASMKAYGAVIYVRTLDENNIWCTLLTAKSRVAPLKTISIPRLELCAADLLSSLMFEVRERCGLKYVPYYLFTDSTITLQWIQKESTIFKQFVANRVANIQRNTKQECWFHVTTERNPADLLSRGLSVLELKHSNLWWQGPDFLSESHEKWPNKVPEATSEQMNSCMGEYKASVFSIVGVVRSMKDCLTMEGKPLIELYKSLGKVVRITAYVRSWLVRIRTKPAERSIGFSDEELNFALEYWIRFTQYSHFAREIRTMKTHGNYPAKSDLLPLKPFFGKDGLLRVWGRIENADVSYDERHPIIIPAHSHFARLLMLEAHFKTKHGNIQAMMHYVRAKYWVIQSKRAALKVVKSCVRCIRYAQINQEQLMSDLPKERLTVAPPFTYCGVDHFGPVKLKRFEGRCKTIVQGYVAVFVCMTTKMIHLECCSDLTTEKFIWALTRFSSVYRVPKVMMSDNGRTFVGAKNELKRIAESWQTTEMRDWITGNDIQWKFITPRGPNQGGLWEAAVKSTKYHMKRIIGMQQLTYERYQTILAGVSAVLNSRPLVPLSSDPFDLNFLTPAHAVQGCRRVQPLTRNLSHSSMSEIKHHRAMDKMKMDFWNAFRKDYLSILQTRYKWNTVDENLRSGDFVIVKEDNLPPGQWCVARIIEVYPGSDGLVRNVRVQTAQSECDRPVRNLVKLPFNDEAIEDDDVPEIENDDMPAIEEQPFQQTELD